MNLDILSFEEALNYKPKPNSYAIRIFDSRSPTPILDLEKSENWVAVKDYSFDDVWPMDWIEYGWADLGDEYLGGILSRPWKEIKASNPEMTKKSLISYIESKGWPQDREFLFNEYLARKILEDYEEVGLGADNIMIHCGLGKNRSPAVGIAMNEIYEWGFEGLKEKFPDYRRFIYDKMKSVEVRKK